MKFKCLIIFILFFLFVGRISADSWYTYDFNTERGMENITSIEITSYVSSFFYFLYTVDEVVKIKEMETNDRIIIPANKDYMIFRFTFSHPDNKEITHGGRYTLHEETLYIYLWEK